jgi:hypothetical protein
MSIVDYSSYSKFLFCPWAWYENYENQMQLRYVGQRSDPLCLGSLVHNALDNFAKTGKPFVDEDTIRENNPTPDTMAMAEVLVVGYLRKYPKEYWPTERAEQPLKFPLSCCDYSQGPNCSKCGYDAGDIPGNTPNPCNALFGLAKLDGYFYVPEDTTIESGLDGYTLTLSRGWWGKEYKTKAHGRNRAEWIKEWQTKRQADFQILALKHLLESADAPKLARYAHGYDMNMTPQGILICVLEKPHEYVPKRKCAKCRGDYDLQLYRPMEHGFACPACDTVQELSPYIPKVPKIPEYFRVTTTRNSEQLSVAKREITAVAIRMDRMRMEGMEVEQPNRDACVNNVYRRQCAYMEPHTYGGTTATDARYEKVDATKYRGLVDIT